MLELIIIIALAAATTLFLLYKWSWNFWKCDYCACFWAGYIYALIFDALDKEITVWWGLLLALLASLPAYLILSISIIKHDNHRCTGRY